MRRDEDEDWEASASVTFSQIAESEFSRLKHDLKVRAGLVPKTRTARLLGAYRAIVAWTRTLLRRLF